MPVDPSSHDVRRTLELERFRAWRRTGDLSLRDAILADSRGIAVALATRFADRGIDRDDLIQVAELGLLLAAERFDPERDVPFVAFAIPTVLGELRRHFRSAWSVRMPRALQEASARATSTIAQLEQELQRTPTASEVAAQLGWSRESVLEALNAASAFRTSSLDQTTDHGSSQHHGTPSQDRPSPRGDASYDLIDITDEVSRLLPRLSERSRRIVELRFFEELTQSEIAARLGISQMHVSRLLRAALELLRQPG